MSSYRIVQTPDGKHWVIVSPEVMACCGAARIGATSIRMRR